MENTLMLFNNTEFNNVRIVRIGGQLWFVGKDVCQLFGDKNHVRSLSRVDDEDKKIITLETKGGQQNMTAVNESGLYTLLFNMQPQKANKGISNAYLLGMGERVEKLNKFRRWVTHDVLPTVRKEGEYQTPAVVERREALLAEILKEYDDKQKKAYEDSKRQGKYSWTDL